MAKKFFVLRVPRFEHGAKIQNSLVKNFRMRQPWTNGSETWARPFPRRHTRKGQSVCGIRYALAGVHRLSGIEKKSVICRAVNHGRKGGKSWRRFYRQYWQGRWPFPSPRAAAATPRQIRAPHPAARRRTVTLRLALSSPFKFWFFNGFPYFFFILIRSGCINQTITCFKGF